MQDWKEKTCCFTGHRELIAEELADLQEQLELEIIRHVQNGICCFGAGGARGFDMLAELTVLRVKLLYPQIRLILVLPCRDQDKSWSETERAIYSYIWKRADKIVCLSEHYFPGCMNRRNRHLVNGSSACICYLTKNTGGTRYTVNYALSKNLQVINLAEAVSLQ